MAEQQKTRRNESKPEDDASQAAERPERRGRTPSPHGTRPDRKQAVAAGLAAASAGLLAAGAAGPAETAKQAAADLTSAELLPKAAKFELKREWDLPTTRNEHVDFFVEFLMGKNYDKTRTWLERTGKYGPLIQSELRKAGMPEDLLYLAMIESGLDPNAYSAAHAAGLWQFIAETGQRYGLEVSGYVDERRDPIKATQAAIGYLGQLNDRFGGSWYLAAAGYNTGENRVDRILRERAGGARGEEDLFWQIMKHLPRETRDYVPVMLAMGHIAKDPERYGFTDLRYEEPLEFREVVVPGGTPLEEVASAAGVDAEQLADLNPHLVKEMTPPDRDWPVRVPVGTDGQVAAHFAGVTGALAD